MDRLSKDFSNAWYKLVTRDMGPVSRCFGSDVPPPQEFQYPLPSPPSPPDWSLVKKSIIDVMYTNSDILKPDYANTKAYYGAWFVKLAWQCASTFRKTDYLGGCNGARIRFSPQKDWPQNIAMNTVLNVLQSVKDIYGDNLTWADLIVFAGTLALEEASGMSYAFCGGRSDATEGSGSEFLNMLNYPDLISEFNDRTILMGLTKRQSVALQGRIRSKESQIKLGYQGSWMGEDVNALRNEYFKILLENSWIPVDDKEVKSEKKDDLFMMSSDLVMINDAPLLAIVKEFAGDENLFKNEFR